MAARYFGLIPAAGSGSRFGGELPKQYRLLAGKPLLVHAIDALTIGTPLARVYVVHAHDDHRCAEVVGARGDVELLPCGGATRAESVRNGLVALRGELEDGDWLLVHDAARACLSTAALRRLIEEVAGDDIGGLLAIPVADTLKRANGESRVQATQAREDLWQAQTPQMFRFGVLWEAFKPDRALECTDEAQAVERLGHHPKLVRGDSANIKITWPSDFELAAAILAGQRACA